MAFLAARQLGGEIIAQGLLEESAMALHARWRSARAPRSAAPGARPVAAASPSARERSSSKTVPVRIRVGSLLSHFLRRRRQMSSLVFRSASSWAGAGTAALRGRMSHQSQASSATMVAAGRRPPPPVPSSGSRWRSAAQPHITMRVGTVAAFFRRAIEAHQHALCPRMAASSTASVVAMVASAVIRRVKPSTSAASRPVSAPNADRPAKRSSHSAAMPPSSDGRR